MRRHVRPTSACGHRSTGGRLLAAVVAVAVLAGCAGVDSDVAATVDGETVSRSFLESEVRVLTATTGSPESLDASQREALVGTAQRDVLALLVQVQVIENLAVQRDISIDREEAEQRAAEDIEALGGEEAFEEVLIEQNLTVALFRDALLPAQLTVEAIRDQLVEDVPPLETRTARHVLVDTQAEADEVLAALADGADFAAVAAERSTDVGSAERGGDLGPAPQGSYVPAFEEAVWTTPVGEVVGPIETEFGFHVLEVTAIDAVAASDLDPAQIDQLVGQELTTLLDEAFAAAEVTIAAGLGTWDSTTGSVVPPEQVGDAPQGAPAIGARTVG